MPLFEPTERDVVQASSQPGTDERLRRLQEQAREDRDARERADVVQRAQRANR